MALNPPMHSARLPLGIAGEAFLLERSGMSLDLSLEGPDAATVGGKISDIRGRVILTTVRMCFVRDSPGSPAGFTAVDIPLQGLTGEKVVQPIFGCNRLEGTVAPVPGRGLSRPTKFALYFRQGGMAKFLRVFFWLREKYMVADSAARNASLAAPRVQAFLQHESVAYVDPGDPSRLFVEQPAFAAPPAGPAGPYGPTVGSYGPPAAAGGVPVATPAPPGYGYPAAPGIPAGPYPGAPGAGGPWAGAAGGYPPTAPPHGYGAPGYPRPGAPPPGTHPDAHKGAPAGAYGTPAAPAGYAHPAAPAAPAGYGYPAAPAPSAYGGYPALHASAPHASAPAAAGGGYPPLSHGGSAAGDDPTADPGEEPRKPY